MRYMHFEINGTRRYGLLEDGLIHEIEGDLFGKRKTTSTRHELKAVRILPPIASPGKVIGTYINDKRFYPPGVEPWRYTHFYLKTPDSVIGSEDNIELPHFLDTIETELELVAVIGHTAKNVSREEAMDYVLGFTVGNDVTVSNDAFLRRPPLGPLRLVGLEEFEFAKWLKEIDAVLSISFKAIDTFAPIGPCIATDLDLRDLTMTVKINGKVVEEGSTATMLEHPSQIISDISQAITLRPGDLVFTGTQTHLHPMKAGDLVELTIQDVGVLRNRVVKQAVARQLKTSAKELR